MLKLPKGLKKKKKAKKSKRKGEEELFTEEELEKYRREHQHTDNGEEIVKENEEWSKFKDLTTGIDSVLKKTQGDLDRIKSTSFFQRVPTGTKQVERPQEETLHRPIVEVTAADFPHLVQATEDDGDKSDYGITDDESEEEYQDDIFDTSYVEAVERGEVKLAYVPDSPDQYLDDDIFDTSHVDALIKGQESRSSRGKKTLDIGVAVEVLTGRIDNVTVTTKKSKRAIPGDLLLENNSKDPQATEITAAVEPEEKSILDIDADIPLTTPIDLSVSFHTSLIQPLNKADKSNDFTIEVKSNSEEEFDEFTLLATESLEVNAEITRLRDDEIKLEAVVQDSWSAFEADKNDSVFAECIVEDQIDIIDPYFDLDDPFDTSFAEALVLSTKSKEVCKEAVILEDDDEFDPRAEESLVRLNNRRKSSVRIHLINPLGIRESITSDDIQGDKEEDQISCDLLGGSTTDLSQLEESLLNPIDVTDSEVDPFDTTIVDKIVAPGKIELKFLEQELFETKLPSIYKVPSDPDFDPRADEPKRNERRASRPENLIVNKTVVFDVNPEQNFDLDIKPKIVKPLTPYYTRELSITESINEDSEGTDNVPEFLTKTRSDEDLTSKPSYPTKRRHSDFPQLSHIKVDFKAHDIYQSIQSDITAKVLTPVISESTETVSILKNDPFDTSYASVAPSKTELKLLAKEFSCEETSVTESKNTYDFLEPSDDIFQVKALSPEPQHTATEETFDPFDTSFAADLNLGKTELKLLESEFLN